MTPSEPVRRYRFGAFEADSSTGELRRQGTRIRLNAQPFQVLLMLLERPNEVLTREEIARALWPDGTFVDFDHGVNSALNRIREALGDAAGNPRFIETLARRGYRFIAPVERIGEIAPASSREVATSVPSGATDSAAEHETEPANRILASQHELPHPPHRFVRITFLLLQMMYLGFYIGTLANLAEIEDLISPIPEATLIFYVLICTAAILIAVRAYLLSAIALRAPQMRSRYLRMWPFLLIADVLWALSPFLLMHHISMGVALACMALLVYSPFAQRSLILMGADEGAKTQSAQA